MSLFKAIVTICQSNFPINHIFKKYNIYDFLKIICNCGFHHFVEEELQKGIPIKDILQYRKDLEALNISVSCMTVEEGEEIGTDTLPELSKLLGKLPTQKPTKRNKGKFAKIRFDKVTSRYCCNISLYDENGKWFRKSIADKDKDKLEQKIWNQLIYTCNNNLKKMQGNLTAKLSILQRTIKSIENFRTTIKQTELLTKIDDVLNQMDSWEKIAIKKLNEQENKTPSAIGERK